MIDAHEAGFLADIRANPDDDAPRLIYADWLEEQGPSPERPDWNLYPQWNEQRDRLAERYGDRVTCEY
jgi:uncharacterized protein (TIGR02996 family)